MTIATLETTVAAGAAEAFENALANVGELTTKDVYTALVVCAFLQNLFKTARVSIENALGQGGEAKTFADKYDRAITALDTAKGTVSRVLTKAKGSRLPALGEELISRLEDLDTDLANLREFLGETLATAKAPSRPTDWQRVREVEEAHARGETKPFRKTTRARNGN